MRAYYEREGMRIVGGEPPPAHKNAQSGSTPLRGGGRGRGRGRGGQKKQPQSMPGGLEPMDTSAGQAAASGGHHEEFEYVDDYEAIPGPNDTSCVWAAPPMGN
jgi:hypothetical protein